MVAEVGRLFPPPPPIDRSEMGEVEAEEEAAEEAAEGAGETELGRLPPPTESAPLPLPSSCPSAAAGVVGEHAGDEHFSPPPPPLLSPPLLGEKGGVVAEDGGICWCCWEGECSPLSDLIMAFSAL